MLVGGSRQGEFCFELYALGRGIFLPGRCVGPGDLAIVPNCLTIRAVGFMTNFRNLVIKIHWLPLVFLISAWILAGWPDLVNFIPPLAFFWTEVSSFGQIVR